MSIPGSGSPLLLATTAAAAADAAYVIPKSLRFNSGDSALLDKTFSTAGNRKTWTWSGWVKLSKLGTTRRFWGVAGSSDTTLVDCRFETTDKLIIAVSSTQWRTTTQVFRDCSSFYHIVFAVDTTQSTANDRVKVYVNGSQITDFDVTNNPSQNSDTGISQAAVHRVGSGYITSNSFDGLMADVQFVDGLALAPTDFGETRSSDGVWVPKEYTGSYGPAVDQTQTWSSALSDSTGFASGNGATKAFDGIATADNTARASAQNTTTTFQPATDIAYTSKVEVWTYFSGSVSLNGGSAVTVSNDQDWRTIATGSGTLDTLTFTGSSSYVYLGAIRIDGVLLVDPGVTVPHNGFHLNFSDSSTNEALGFDSAPTTPDPDPKKGFDVVTYSGTSARQNIGGLNFEPGLLWIKVRSGSQSPGAQNHYLVDSVRGATGAVTKKLYSNSTGAENASQTDSENGIEIHPNGFALTSSNGGTNISGNNYVAWTWQAGGPAVSKTAGTINAEVSASTDYGFSICKFTGTGTAGTIEHGLSTVPKWYIVKNLDTSPSEWNVFHVSTGETKRLKLNSNSAAQTAANSWNDTAPTASLFTVGTDTDVNKSGDEHIAYVWSEVSGYSKFGTYEGASTVTVTTGFKPRWILLKNVDTAGSWSIFDSERDSDLEINHRIYANESSAEGTDTVIGDFTDTGFTLTNQGNSNWNTTGDTFVYAAFADRPGNNWDVNNIVTNEGLTTSKSQFDVALWTGDGSSSQSISSLSFQPDLVWLKGRSYSISHLLYDSVRGFGADKDLVPNGTNAEGAAGADSTYGYVSAVSSTGFTVQGGSSANDGYTNKSGATYVAWCWKAGGTAVSNTDGDLTASVSANAAYGFSIIKFTTASNTSGGATVGHGLGAKPSLYIYKPTSASGEWVVVSSHDYDQFAYLNATTQFRSISSQGGGTPADPTNSVLSLYDLGVALASKTYICYAFANVPGYQRVGQYTGNGSSTGPVVVTGFKPRFLIVKRTDSTGAWVMLDSERNPVNPRTKSFYADVSDAEYTPGQNWADFDESSFQLTATYGEVNASGGTYVYLAIGDDEIGSDEDCLVDVPNAVTADADATDTTGGYQRGNYCTLNPLYHGSTMSNGNLNYVSGAANISTVQAVGTIGVASGKWYWEATLTASSGSYTNTWFIGVVKSDFAQGTTIYNQSNNVLYYGENGNKYVNNSGSSYGASLTNGDVVGVALDLDNDSIVFYKNGVSQGSISYTFSGTYLPCISNGDDTSSVSATLNFGQMRFKYPMPSGYAALNTTALPAATIEDGSKHFTTHLYSGTGAAQTISGLNLSPDMAWIKERNGTSWHRIIDVVRGQKEVFPNANNAESSFSQGLNSFNSDGFTLGTGSDSNVNTSGNTYVSWLWDAGSSTANNTDGSVTTSVRANQTAGFSICTFTSPSSGNFTIGHGLNVVPEFVLVKTRGATSDWSVYHKSISTTTSKYLILNTTIATDTYNYVWGAALPTTSVVGLTSGGAVATSQTCVAYCFTSVAGYSAFGSYEGNGSSDGPFVHTGFRPALVIIKRTDSAEQWYLNDAARDTFNVTGKSLRAQSTGTEASTGGSNSATWDILSNGFKLRDSGGGSNASGGDYIYMAWASNPFSSNGGLAR